MAAELLRLMNVLYLASIEDIDTVLFLGAFVKFLSDSLTLVQTFTAIFLNPMICNILHSYSREISLPLLFYNLS